MEKLKTVELTKEEIENIVISLNCRIGIIETGEPMIRACDVYKDSKYKIKALSLEQMQLILDTETLLKKLYN